MFSLRESGSVLASSRPVIFPSKVGNIFRLRIDLRPGLVQGRDGIQFLDDNIWTMDDNIGRDGGLISPLKLTVRVPEDSDT